MERNPRAAHRAGINPAGDPAATPPGAPATEGQESFSVQGVVGGQGRVPVGTKFAFGLGATAENVALTLIGSYTLFFYNQVLGMPATLAGLAITISIVADGFADPIAGSLSDRTRSRWGRRHPFMFAAPIPIGLSMLALFNPPELSTPALFGWLLVFLISLRVCMAVYHTPHLALGGELSPDYTERTRVMSWNQLMGLVGGQSANFLALSLFFYSTPQFSRGLLNPDAYPPFSVAFAAAAVVLLLASAWFTRHWIPRLPQPPENLPRFSPFEFLKDLGGAISNRNYLWLLLGMFFISLMVGLRHALMLYMNTYYWGLASEQLRWFVLGTIVGVLTGFLFSARMHGRFDKRTTVVIASVNCAFTPAIAPVLSLMGLFPRPGDPILLPLLIALDGAHAIGTSIITISIMSALADIADQNELRFGRRQEGVLYSTRTLFAKIDVAIGQLAAGFALDMLALPKGHGHQALPPIEHDGLRGLAIFYALTMVPGVIATFFYSRYGIDRRAFDETRARLAEMRQQRAGPEFAPPETRAPGLGGIKPAEAG